MTTPPLGDAELLAHDRRLEQQVGSVLGVGVTVAALLALAGGIVLLWRSGGTAVNVAPFHGEPESLRSVGAVIRSAIAGDPAAIVQLALILLIATPIARVAVTFVSFVRRRDQHFILITGFVLALLLFSLL